MFRFLYFNAAFLIDCFYLDAANKSPITTVSGRKKFNCFLSKKITYPIKYPVQTPYFIWAETNSINYLHVMYEVWINSKRLVKFGLATGLYLWLSREWRLWTSVDFDPELHLSRTKCINFYNLVYLIAPIPPLNLVWLPWNKDGSVNQFSHWSKLINVGLNSN